MTTIKAQWADWNGSAFARRAESMLLPARETPKLYLVRINDEFEQRLKKFDRVGRPNKSWHVYYGPRSGRPHRIEFALP